MGMEDDTRKFLLTIVNTIAMILIWMIAQVLAGIYFDLAFFENRPSIFNIAYYLFFVSTLILLFIYIRRKWKGMI
jgi:hypothetical protein